MCMRSRLESVQNRTLGELSSVETQNRGGPNRSRFSKSSCDNNDPSNVQHSDTELSVSRSGVGYQSRLAAKDAPVLQAMRTLAGQYPRFGYRMVMPFLARQQHVMSADRAYRLWRQAGLQVPKRRPRRRIATSRPRLLPATGANHVWAYDFIFDSCANGQTLQCLTVIDEFTRECLAIDVAGGIRSGRVIEVLTKLVSVHGAPRYLRSDNVLNSSSVDTQN